MRLIGAGLPRTGTLTQKLAVEMLGLGPCYHWVDVLADLRRVEQWQRALDGKEPWEEIFAGFNSSVDWPGGYFYKELMESYPAAKVLLSVRAPEAWERSFRETIWNMGHGESLLRLLSSARARVDPQWRDYLALVERMFWGPEGTFAKGHATSGELIAEMERHNEEVMRVVPAERLLVWQVGEGWEPLCEFLEVKVPLQALPHVNDRETFMGRVADGAITTLRAWREEQTALSA